ncbi:SLAC1 anion channel family protein [Schlegelella aquatica]|uniref:SLAC1 anion channel family protein n=1 Tax=Caldimonas aquatica TaxID=376175 RepID=UPI00375327C3
MTSRPPHAAQPLRFLMPGWFAAVMGLSGLALAWWGARHALGELAAGVSALLALVAALAFMLLALLSIVRWQRHPDAVREDLHHPVRHAFWATIPISGMLLATLWVAHLGASEGARALWWVSSLAQLAVTVAVTARWWKGNQPGGLVWPAITPALFIPIVGNVLAPLAGVPLGHPEWSAAQFGIGLVFWPVVLVLIMVRKATTGLWPERLLPTAFIHVAPPAVGALSLMQFGAPVLVVWAAWGMALVFLLWAATQVRRIASLPFGVPHWAMSFPLAAFSGLTLRLSEAGHGGMQLLGVVALSLTSLVIAGLVLGTARGLRQGTLLVPEPAPAAPVLGADVPSGRA